MCFDIWQFKQVKNSETCYFEQHCACVYEFRQVRIRGARRFYFVGALLFHDNVQTHLGALLLGRVLLIGTLQYVSTGPMYKSSLVHVNTLRPRQNGRHFPDDIFKRIFLNENVWILIIISVKFVPRGPINNIPTLVQVMAWRRPGDAYMRHSASMS